MARKKLRVKTEKQEKSFVIATVTQLKQDNPEYLQLYRLVDEFLRTSMNKKQLKAEAVAWAKVYRKESLSLVKSMEDWRFIVFGKLCFILNHNGELSEEGHRFIEDKLSEFGTIFTRKKITTVENKKKTNKLSVQDYLRIKAQSVVGERFEPVIDNIFEDPKYKVDIVPFNIMHEEEISQGHARYILKMFVSDIRDLQAIVDGTADQQLKEGYSNVSKIQIKRALRFYQDIHKAANMIIQKSIANRKPRSKVKKSIDYAKAVSKFKYMKQDTDLGLVSESPIKIIGAKEVWVYNTKTRKIGKYVALDSTGLGVKGTTIKNFSSEKSRQKTLRKPKQQLKQFSGGTRKFNNQFKAVKAVDIAMKTRSNDEMIILKCFK